jgi:uroporphyrin-III C-methyltransferase
MSLAAAIERLNFAGLAFPPGEVWLAGAGPGSVGCLTLEVVHALSCADAVVYDALVEPAILEAAQGAERHFVGKRGGQPSTPQPEINALLVSLAKAGKRVLRLKGGDPNLFGRGGEEALALAASGVAFRFLPGITAAFGALAAASIPATMRGTNTAIILATGHLAGEDDDLDWAALVATGQPIVVYMGMSRLPRITDALMAGGASPQTPAAVIVSATTDGERIVVAELDKIAAHAAEASLASPGLVVVGDIVALRERLGR